MYRTARCKTAKGAWEITQLPEVEGAFVAMDPRDGAVKAMVGGFDYPGLGAFPALPVPLKFDGWEAPEVGRPPLLGEHTDEILRNVLGYDAARIAALREAKAI